MLEAHAQRFVVILCEFAIVFTLPTGKEMKKSALNRIECTGKWGSGSFDYFAFGHSMLAQNDELSLCARPLRVQRVAF